MNSGNGKLKFRLKEHGRRDTVVKLASAPAKADSSVTESPSSPETAQQTPARARKDDQFENKNESPLLKKIKQALVQSDPSKWEMHGTSFNAATKTPKPYEYWEMFYTTDIANGILVFRSSLPVTSQFFGGGYTLSPRATERYFVELRPKAWNPKTLLDPYFRSSLDKDKQVQILADGDVAKSVFFEVRELVSSFSCEKRLEAMARIDELVKNITDVVQNSDASIWSKSEQTLGTISFCAIFEGIKVEISQTIKDRLENYRFICSKDQFASKTADSGLAKDLFFILDEKSKSASLEALSKVLEDAGF